MTVGPTVETLSRTSSPGSFRSFQRLGFFDTLLNITEVGDATSINNVSLPIVCVLQFLHKNTLKVIDCNPTLTVFLIGTLSLQVTPESEWYLRVRFYDLFKFYRIHCRPSSNFHICW